MANNNRLNSLQQDVLSFMKVCDKERFSLKEIVNQELNTLGEDNLLQQTELWGRLINEETNELYTHMSVLERDVIDRNPLAPVMANILDDLVDIVYVVMGMANALNLPFQEAWDRVQKANMAKAIKQDDETYKVKKRASDGKVLKPEGWQPPDIEGVIRECLNQNS